jgi:hypothetical protein
MPSKRQLPPTRGLPFRPGPWGCMPASHVHSDGQETVRRSFPSRPPKTRRPRRAGVSLPSGRKFEPVPLSSPAHAVTGDKPRNLVDPKDTPRNTQETEPADLVTRARPAAQSIRICRCAHGHSKHRIWRHGSSEWHDLSAAGAYWSGKDGQRREAHADHVACSGGTGGI